MEHMEQMEEIEEVEEVKSKNGFSKGVICGALGVVIVFVALSFLGIVTLPGSSVLDSTTQKKLATLQRLVEKSYLHEYTDEQLQDGILSGYINGLDDVYSVYYNKEETKELNESTSGKYCGIGAVLTQAKDTGVITIINVYKDSPAEKAGIKADDILYKVEEEEVTGVDLSAVVSKIKGDEGTKVKMTVLRGEKAEEIEVTAVRAEIDIETVAYEMKDDGIGYLQISQFDLVTYDQFVAALEDLKKQGMKGLVIDLRSNPGGLLSSVCSILDEMLPEELLVYTEDKNGKRQEEMSDERDNFDLPLVVLVNGNSASASEIFTGAIQDYKEGTIVGTQTYGKGVVQQIYSLNDGTSVKLTVSEYFTPKGRSINKKGITPDVVVEYEADEKNPEADNQLDKAMEVLKEKMK